MNEDSTIDDVIVPKQPLLMIMGRNFDSNHPTIINSHPILIHEVENASKGTGFKTWDGAVELAKYLEANPHAVSGKKVLELGAGTGLAGIATCILGASYTLLTDLEYSIDNLRENVLINSAAYPNGTQSNVAILDWGDERTYPSKDIIWDVIIGADIVWLDNLVPLLVKALDACCSLSTTVYLAHQSRSKFTDASLFESLERLFIIERVSTNPIDCKIVIYRLLKRH